MSIDFELRQIRKQKCAICEKEIEDGAYVQEYEWYNIAHIACGEPNRLAKYTSEIELGL